MEDIEEVHPGVAQCPESLALMAGAEEVARTLGLSTRWDFDVLVIEMRTRGNHWGDCFVVPALELLADVKNLRSLSRTLRRLHSLLYSDDNRNRTAQVFVLGTVACLADPAIAAQTEFLSTDGSFGVKFVGTLQDLQRVLSPAFPVVPDVPLPRLYTGPTTRLDFHRTEPPIDACLRNFDIRREQPHVWDLTSDTGRALLVDLYGRVLGPRRELQLQEDGPVLWWPGAGGAVNEGLPVEYGGNGELMLFGLLKFLVKQYECARPAKVICIEDVPSSFDVVTQSKLLNIFADFCSSTGAFLYLKVAQSGFRDWAGRRFTQVFGPDSHSNLGA